MRKDELAEKVTLAVNATTADRTRDTFTDKATVLATINAFTEVIKQAVADGQPVTIRGFGSFQPVRRAAKVARNLKTLEAIEVPAHTKPVFIPSDDFRQKVATSQSIA